MPCLAIKRRVRATAAVVMAMTSATSGVERENVAFSTTQTTVFGESIYVLGDIPELGSNDVTRAVKLEPGAYPLWRVTIAIPKDTSYTYRFTRRNDSPSNLANPSNNTYLTSPIAASTGAGNPAVPSKSVFYHSGFARPVLNWRQGGGAWTALPMKRIAVGRGPGEWRWNARGFGQPERALEFYFTDASSAGRDPASGQYATLMDTVFVQDGHLCAFVPPGGLSLPVQTNFSMFSTALNETRGYRVLVPRGYANSAPRRYPVLYMHDGQNVFDMGPFGTWNADETAAQLIRAGQMQDMIIVGVDNGPNRIRDYLPPDDTYSGQAGRANVYANFLINELKPIIDANYRTLSGRAHTSTMGSSMGGLVSLYLGWDYNATFGHIGAMSGSWQFQNFPNRVQSGPKKNLRIYLDSGNAGTSQDNCWPTLNLRDGLLRLGYALDGDMYHTIGYGQQHNEAAWAARLPGAFTYLFNAAEGPNELGSESTRPIGDIDDDGDVDAIDIDLMVAALLGMPVDPIHETRADIDGNGRTDGEDAAAFTRLAWVNM